MSPLAGILYSLDHPDKWVQCGTPYDCQFYCNSVMKNLVQELFAQVHCEFLNYNLYSSRLTT